MILMIVQSATPCIAVVLASIPYIQTMKYGNVGSKAWGPAQTNTLRQAKRAIALCRTIGVAGHNIQVARVQLHGATDNKVHLQRWLIFVANQILMETHKNTLIFGITTGRG